jgi:hypothetical protein
MKKVKEGNASVSGVKVTVPRLQAENSTCVHMPFMVHKGDE